MIDERGEGAIVDRIMRAALAFDARHKGIRDVSSIMYNWTLGLQ